MSHRLSQDPEPHMYPTFKMYRHSLPQFGSELCKALTQQTKNEHLNTTEPITCIICGHQHWFLRASFMFLPYIAICIPNRKIFVNSHHASHWLALIPKQKSCKADISEARLMLKCQLQCGTKHLVIGSAVILEVTALLIPAWCFPDVRIWGDWSHWGQHVKYFLTKYEIFLPVRTVDIFLDQCH